MSQASSEIPANLQAVRERIAAAAIRADRDPAGVELVVVTKTWPAETVRQVVESGHELLGENKLQDAAEKIPQLPESVRWHFIGHLQRNKARKAVELFEAIHSVDSLRLASHLSRIAGELGRVLRIYLQINAAGEASKSGFSKERIRAEIGELLNLEHLEVAGLMSIPPAVDDPEEARGSFRELVALRDELQDLTGVPLPGLSMGMSQDYEVAIEEGATIVRVGSAIFGPRLASEACAEPGPETN